MHLIDISGVDKIHSLEYKQTTISGCKDIIHVELTYSCVHPVSPKSGSAFESVHVYFNAELLLAGLRC